MLQYAGDARDMGSIPGSGTSVRVGNGNPLQYSCLENPVDRGTWWVAVRGVAESRTQLKQLSSSSSSCSGNSYSVLEFEKFVGRKAPGPSLT